MKKKNVVIAIPTMGNVNAETFDNYMDFFYYMGKREKNCGYKFHIWTSPRLLVSVSREEVAKQAIDMGMDYILFLDDDMLIQKDIFFRLVKHDVDVVAPLAFQRLGEHKPVIYNYKVNRQETSEDGTLLHRLQWENICDYDERPEGLYEYDAVGFGVVLLKVNILETIKKPWFMSQMQIGEDLYFCHKARQAGIKIHVDTSIKTGHVGTPQIISEETFKLFRKMKNENGDINPDILATRITSKVY